MFGDLFGNLEEKQAALKEELAKITVTGAAGEQAVVVTANANREITNVQIDPSKLDLSDAEQLEDFFLIAANQALAAAAETEAVESQKLIQDMMPPGLAGLGGMFGQ